MICEINITLFLQVDILKKMFKNGKAKMIYNPNSSLDNDLSFATSHLCGKIIVTEDILN